MKQLLSLNQEYIIETKFVADTIKDEQTGYVNPAWIDEKKQKATGRKDVDHVILMVEILDREGYHSPLFQKVWISKCDIISLAEKIKEIDAIKCDGYPR